MYALIQAKKRSLRELLDQKRGNDSLLNQIQMDCLEYDMLPPWLKARKNSY